MNRIKLNQNDYFNAFQNNQEIMIGDGSDLDDTQLYFITSIIGTDVTITDKDSTDILTVSNFDFSHPVILDGGFTAAGTDNTVIYYKIPKGSN